MQAVLVRELDAFDCTARCYYLTFRRYVLELELLRIHTRNNDIIGNTDLLNANDAKAERDRINLFGSQ